MAGKPSTLSVSGGCIEGAVYEAAREVLETGVPQLVRYGVSDDNAFSAGLTWGTSWSSSSRSSTP
jgi:xanthine dehydrogenase accessory factor